MSNEKEKWSKDDLEIAMGPKIEERTDIEKKELYRLSLERGNIDALNEICSIIDGKKPRSAAKTQLECQSDSEMRLRISKDRQGRKEVFGFGALANASSDHPLTPEMLEQMRSLSAGGPTEDKKKKGFWSRVFGR
jgi:hypothetical protein